MTAPRAFTKAHRRALAAKVLAALGLRREVRYAVIELVVAKEAA